MRMINPARLCVMFALAVGIGLGVQPTAAQAAEDGYSLMVGFPVSYKFTKDENTNESPEAKSPSGIRLMLNTPVNLGVGVGSYTAGFEETQWPWGGREIEYSFLEIMFTIPVSIVRFGIGFGLGSAEFTPARVNAPAPLSFFYQEFKKSDAQEWFVMVGARLTDAFGVHAGFHAMTIDVKIDTFGTESSGDLGATMGVLNGSYYF